MLNLEEQTYTGKPLEDMTLAEKELEMAKDWAYLQGLKHGFFWNAKHLGSEYAVQITAKKAKLKVQGKLESIIQSYEQQIQEGRQSIQNDKEALQFDGYRGVKISDHVQSTLDKLTASEDPKHLKDTLMYVKLKMEELQKERRKYTLEQKYEGQKAETKGEKIKKETKYAIGKVANFFKDNMNIIVPVSVALTLGGESWYGLTSYFDSQNRNRPTRTVSHIIHPGGESIEEEHPGVEAAIAVNDAAMLGNAEVNEYLNANFKRSKSLEDLNEKVLPMVEKAKEKISSSSAYYEQRSSSIANMANGGSAIGSSWSYSSYRSTHTVCTISTDSKGNSHTNCHTVCDYLDEAWKFDPSTAARGIAIFEAGLASLNMPASINILALQEKVRRYQEGTFDFKNLKPEEQDELYKKMTDFLRSVTVAGNNDLVSRLAALKTSASAGEFSWIKGNTGNRSTFPLLTEKRSYACIGSASPEGYTRSENFAGTTDALNMHYAKMLNSMHETNASLGAYETKMNEINKKINAGATKKELDVLYDELGEITIKTHKALNPDSDYTLWSKGWRIAFPLLALFGLGALGGAGSYFGLRALRENRFHRRMGKRGYY